MDLKISKEILPASVSVFDGIQEQSVEMDYVLPDYYPDIFRLVRCEIVPVITERAVSGDRLSYTLRCDIRILCCGENDSIVRCVEQTRTFQKTVELEHPCDSPEIKLCPKTDHINFRAVNKRRLDIRGAVSVKVSVTCESPQEVISDAAGMNIQLRRTPVRAAVSRLTADKQLRISEETELTAAQPAVMNVINCRCTLSECEKKLISGKLLAKGDVSIDSQIIDIDGIDDTYDCSVAPEVISCEVTPTAGKDGENRILRCELELRLLCRCTKAETIMVGTDAYSTIYPCEVSVSAGGADQFPTVYSESFRHTAKLAEGENVPANIYSVWVTPKNINARIGDDGRSVVISGMLTYSMAARDSSGMISIPDKDETFEETIAVGDDISGSTVYADISAKEVSYNISSEGVLTAKSDIAAKISVKGSSKLSAVTDITVDSSTKKERDGDYAIKLYFGVPDEDVWSIAKRYSTSVSAIMEENELDGDKLRSGGMLLIPIVT